MTIDRLEALALVIQLSTQVKYQVMME